MASSAGPGLIWCKRKAICALFPYAVCLEQDGQGGMVDVILRVARASDSGTFIWHHIKPFITTLLDKQSPPSLNRAIALASPHVLWWGMPHEKSRVTRWAAAVSALSYTEEVGQSVVDALLQIASITSLRPYIPIGVWEWCNHGDCNVLRPSSDRQHLSPSSSSMFPGVAPKHTNVVKRTTRQKKWLSLPPRCLGRSKGTGGDVIRLVRELGDVIILKSYLLLVWSEWDLIDNRSGGLAEMRISIRDDFSGIGMECHRQDLLKRLDDVLEQLDRGLGYLWQRKPGIGEDDIQIAKEQYGWLKRVLLEVDREAVNALARMSPIPSFSEVY